MISTEAYAKSRARRYESALIHFCTGAHSSFLNTFTILQYYNSAFEAQSELSIQVICEMQFTMETC